MLHAPCSMLFVAISVLSSRVCHFHWRHSDREVMSFTYFDGDFSKGVRFIELLVLHM